LVSTWEWFARRQFSHVKGQALIENRQQLHGKRFSTILKKSPCFIPALFVKERTRRMYKHPITFLDPSLVRSPQFQKQESQRDEKAN
jgi:hypothetical protein